MHRKPIAEITLLSSAFDVEARRIFSLRVVPPAERGVAPGARSQLTRIAMGNLLPRAKLRECCACFLDRVRRGCLAYEKPDRNRVRAQVGPFPTDSLAGADNATGSFELL